MSLNDVATYIFKNKNIVLTSSYGNRTYYYNGKKISDFHLGVDYTLKNGNKSKVYAIKEGVVQKIGEDNVSGKYVFIKYSSLNLSVFYCHLSKINVKKNQKVDNNTVVGVTGTTGNSTGIHLHIGMKYLNSSIWVNPNVCSLREYNYTYCASKYIKVISKKTNDYLNFRKTPSIKGKVIKVINKNKVVDIVKENYEFKDGYYWDKIKYDGKTGYVANKYLNYYKGKSTDVLNIRTNASISNNIIKTISKNKTIIIEKRKYLKKDGYYWDKIKL